MKTVNDNGFNQSMNKKSAFLRFMRYVAVALVTVTLLCVFILSIGLNGFDLDLALFVFILIFSSLFLITLPIVGFWIYSFVKAVRRHTKTDKILLWFHIVDLLLLGIIIYLANQPPQRCDADIMAEYYEGENGFGMRNIAASYRNMLPDSTRLCYEIDYEKSYPYVLSEEDTKRLKRELKDCGCIGIDVDNYSSKGYSTIRFRRIGMGMYSYRFYDKPLTLHEQDSINNNECFIVYNDSTVFEFGGGAFGVQHLVGKEEFMEKLHNSKMD